MKNAKKIAALLLGAALLIGASVAGTLAYLTFEDEVVNTFTVGNVRIELYERVGDNSEPVTENQKLHLVPNVAVQKEPFVTVLKDSEDCYVRVKVTVDVSSKWNTSQATAVEPIGNAETFATWAIKFADDYLLNDKTTKGFNTTNWNVSAPTVDNNNHTITYFLNYKKGDNNIIEKNIAGDTVLEPIFNDVMAPSSLTNSQIELLNGMKITVEAHAIQADGFDAANDKTAEQNAWDAFDNQKNS